MKATSHQAREVMEMECSAIFVSTPKLSPRFSGSRQPRPFTGAMSLNNHPGIRMTWPAYMHMLQLCRAPPGQSRGRCGCPDIVQIVILARGLPGHIDIIPETNLTSTIPMTP